MSKEYLDKTGLAYFWSKVKTYIDTAVAGGGSTTSIYAVGDIYITLSSDNPATRFGGTWEEIQGRFLLGCSSGIEAGDTGGSNSVTLTEANLPSHSHTVPNHTHSIPAHGHTASIAESGAHSHVISRERTAAGGTARYAISGAEGGGATKTDGAHTHTVTVADKAAFNTNSSGTCTTGTKGSGTAINTTPAYLAVHIWKRVA